MQIHSMALVRSARAVRLPRRGLATGSADEMQAVAVNEAVVAARQAQQGAIQRLTAFGPVILQFVTTESAAARGQPVASCVVGQFEMVAGNRAQRGARWPGQRYFRRQQYSDRV